MAAHLHAPILHLEQVDSRIIVKACRRRVEQRVLRGLSDQIRKLSPPNHGEAHYPLLWTSSDAGEDLGQAAWPNA